jgi:hypothetical protein
LVHIVLILYIFSSFGIMWPEKSGNPATTAAVIFLQADKIIHSSPAANTPQHLSALEKTPGTDVMIFFKLPKKLAKHLALSLKETASFLQKF